RCTSARAHSSLASSTTRAEQSPGVSTFRTASPRCHRPRMPNNVVELYWPSSDGETLRGVADRLAAGTRTVIWFGALVFAIAGALAAWSFRSVQATDVAVIRPNVEVTGATEQFAMARWAVERFEIAGLEPPMVEIAFHRGLSGCGGHLGLARHGEVDLCATLVD